jgi:antirestriction protein ArdC
MCNPFFKEGKPMKTDLYERVTAQIVASLEQGVKPWLKPWSAAAAQGVRPLRANSEPYRGINVLMLWGAAADHGYACPVWMTFKQALELGGCVRKGEHGSLVVYASTFTRTGTDDKTGEESERDIPFLKGYTVFNVEQIDGLPERFRAPAPALPAGLERIERAEAFAASTGAVIRHGGNRAFFSPSGDFVQMPPFQAFRDAESYYAVLAHELTHWTGHKSRLDRTFGKRFGDKAYAFEELVAELGSAFLAADLALTPEPRPDHAGYLANWLEVLKADKRAIFTAASHAQRAADFLTTPSPAAQLEAA